jgi:hypothetical protein
MATAEERAMYIRKIQDLPEHLESAVQGLNDDQLDTPYGDGKWTVRQVVHHLVDSHLNGFARMRLVLTEDRPTLRTYDQDRWAQLHDARFMPVRSSLLILTGLHARWAELLWTLPEEDWTRTGVHPEWGEVTLESLLVDYAEHCEKHVKHITDLLESRGW